jgi:DNA-binding NarL/FixJ family response regulator
MSAPHPAQRAKGTVTGYLSNVLAKLKLDDRTQAALLAVQLGMDSEDA